MNDAQKWTGHVSSIFQSVFFLAAKNNVLVDSYNSAIAC